MVGAPGPGKHQRQPSEQPLSGREALEVLLAGNRRWVAGQAQHPAQSSERRASIAARQSPFALIVSCIDSRVPPELIFDRGLGDLLVVRSAGHCLDDIVLGSIEFGPVELRTPLILVLGHTGCGAVGAAVQAFQHDRWPPGHLEDVVEAIRPAYKVARQQSGELNDSVARAHAVLTVARLKADNALAELTATDRLIIVGGYYHLDTGAVDIIC